MNRIKLNKRSLIRWKVYIDRARMYIGYLQFLMIGMIFLESFKGQPIGDMIFNNMYIAVPVLLFLFIILSLVVGFLDTRLGLREEELRNASSSNPVLREIQHDLKRMMSELDEIKKEMKSKEKPK